MRAAFAIENFEGGIYTARKKKTTKDEVREGLKRLAFGEIKDAVLLLFAQEGDILSQLPGLDLYNISEIKRPKGGGMEIKFLTELRLLKSFRSWTAKLILSRLAFTEPLRKAQNAYQSRREMIPLNSFVPFSEKQLAVLTWWCNGSHSKDKNGIICDGAVRSGKTLCMSISFVSWAFYRFSGASFAFCGKRFPLCGEM